MARRRNAVRRLILETDDLLVAPEAGPPGTLLGSLQDGALQELQLRNVGSLTGTEADAALQPLRRLPALTRLTLQNGGELERLPCSLSTLQLADLDLGWCEGLGQGQVSQAAGGRDPFGPLLSLGSSLTRLSLEACGLEQLPSQLLQALPRLEDLSLRDNPNLGRSMGDAASGTHYSCGSGGYGSGAASGQLAGEAEVPAAEAALCGLQHATALTRLDLSYCDLYWVPQALAPLQCLAVLQLAANPLLGEGASGLLRPLGVQPGAVFEALQHLTALTRLDLGACCLGAVPQELSRMQHLADLSLRAGGLGGSGEEGEGAFRALQHVTALTRLDLGNFGLHRLPEELSALGSLAHLDLAGNGSLGRAGNETWQPLAHLPALTCLHCAYCGLQGHRLPPHLAALPGSVLDIGRQEESGWQ